MKLCPSIFTTHTTKPMIHESQQQHSGCKLLTGFHVTALTNSLESSSFLSFSWNIAYWKVHTYKITSRHKVSFLLFIQTNTLKNHIMTQSIFSSPKHTHTQKITSWHKGSSLHPTHTHLENHIMTQCIFSSLHPNTHTLRKHTKAQSVFSSLHLNKYTHSENHTKTQSISSSFNPNIHSENHITTQRISSPKNTSTDIVLASYSFLSHNSHDCSSISLLQHSFPWQHWPSNHHHQHHPITTTTSLGPLATLTI